MQHEDMGTRTDLVKYRLETANNDLRSAEILLQAKDY